MTAAELCVLGALSHPVVDARALAWWNSQTDRETLAKSAYGYLAKRMLLGPETDRLSRQAPHV